MHDSLIKQPVSSKPINQSLAQTEQLDQCWRPRMAPTMALERPDIDRAVGGQFVTDSITTRVQATI